MSDQTFVEIKGSLGTVTQKIAARNGIGGKMVLGMKPGTTLTVEETETRDGNIYICFSFLGVEGETVTLHRGEIPEKLWVIASGVPTGSILQSSPMPLEKALDIMKILGTLPGN